MRETPDIHDINSPLLVLIVGHEKKAQGATLATGGSEYEYNSKAADLSKKYAVSRGVRLEVIYRDGIGISGAYKKAMELKPDSCIELHFNAFNKKASGTETLCTPDKEDLAFSKLVHKEICEVFERGGLSRGIKVLARGSRGSSNIYSLPGFSNCLVEPFFGDNEKEAIMALEKQELYAIGLVDATIKYWQSIGFYGIV